MKKALCFVLVLLLMFPASILAVEEGEWATFETPASEAPETAPPSPEPAPEEDKDDVTVRMQVPQSGQILVNPYRCAVETNLGTSTEQIISTTQYLSSRSEVPISVSVEIEGIHSDPDARFVNSEPDSSAKELFLYVEFQPVENDGEPEWIGSYTGADCQILINQSKANVVTVPVGVGDMPGRVAFRVFGAVSAASEKGWDSDDILSITMSYKFNPLGGLEAAEEDSEAENPSDEMQPEDETTEENKTLTEEPEQTEDQAPETEPENTEENPAETETVDEEDEPVEETTPSREEPSQVEDTSRSDDSYESEYDTESIHSKDDESQTENIESEGGLWWFSSHEEESQDKGEQSVDEESSSKDTESEATHAWLQPTDEYKAEPEDDSVPQEDGTKIPVESETEQESQENNESEEAWLSPS